MSKSNPRPGRPAKNRKQTTIHLDRDVSDELAREPMKISDTVNEAVRKHLGLKEES